MREDKTADDARRRDAVTLLGWNWDRTNDGYCHCFRGPQVSLCGKCHFTVRLPDWEFTLDEEANADMIRIMGGHCCKRCARAWLEHVGTHGVGQGTAAGSAGGGEP